jgi:hypothetical protein
MSLVKTVLLSIALTLVASEITQAQATTFNPETQQVFTAVEKIGDNKRAFFPFTASSRNYTIRSDGWTESGSPTILRRFFQLRVGRPGRIDRVYFLEHENDLLLIYELTDEEYGWGYMVRLDQVKRAPKWITPVEGINFGPATVEGGYAYLGSSSVLGKIDLRSGKYVWRQADLKNNVPSIASYGAPSILGDRVVFRQVGGKGRVEVEKSTGRLLALRETEALAPEEGPRLTPRHPLR